MNRNLNPRHKAVFFDRDGTLIVDKVYLNDPDKIEYLPGVFEGLRALRDAGYLFFIVTNQSGVARGLVSLKNLHEIHRRIRFAFAQRGVDFQYCYYAPYYTTHDHIYRKPNPGMLLQAAREFNLDLGACWTLGDRMSDVEAGHRAGTRAILLGTRGAEGEGDDPTFAAADAEFPSVAASVPFILQNDRPAAGFEGRAP